MLAARAAGTALPTLASALVTAVALVPFVAEGYVPGNELVRPAAVVILLGLAAATAVNLFVLPAMCLITGPRSVGPDADETQSEASPAEPPSADIVLGGT